MGLFSKKQYADIIYRNANILTLDPDAAEAEALAVKDGFLLAVGDWDYISSFDGKDTESVDLAGAYVLPGFFTMDGSLIRDAYSEIALPLTGDMNEEEVLRVFADYIRKNPSLDRYLAFGYSDLLFRKYSGQENPETVSSENEKTIRFILDELCSTKPVILLSASGSFGIVNSKALEETHSALLSELRIMQEAEETKAKPLGQNSAADSVLRTKTEEGVDVDGEYDLEDEDAPALEEDTMPAPGDSSSGEESSADSSTKAPEIPNPWPCFRDILPGFQYFGRDENKIPNGFLQGPATISQFLNVTGSFDSELLPKALVKASIAYSKKGYTTVLDAGSPDYLVRNAMSIFTNLLQTGQALQRNSITTLIEDETDIYLSLQRLRQKETLCVECSDFLNANSVRLLAKTVRTDDTGEPESTLSADFISQYATSVLDHGFDVLMITYGKEATQEALAGLEDARGKARKGKLVVLLADAPSSSAHPSMTKEEENAFRDAFDTASIPVIGTPVTNAQKLSVLTGRKRHLFRENDNSGMLIPGEPADFVVLKASPLDEAGEPLDPSSYEVDYTVLGGYPVSQDPDEYSFEDEQNFEEPDEEEE